MSENGLKYSLDWLGTLTEKEFEEVLRIVKEDSTKLANLIRVAYQVCENTGIDTSKGFELLDESEKLAKAFNVPEDEVYNFRLKFIAGHGVWWLKTPSYFDKKINSYVI